jgi:hypothetical protein
MVTRGAGVGRTVVRGAALGLAACAGMTATGAGTGDAAVLAARGAGGAVPWSPAASTPAVSTAAFTHATVE